MGQEYDVIGLGNAIVDVLVEVDDSFLQQLNLKKGAFHDHDKEQIQETYEKIKEMPLKIMPGGSASNTISTISLLGGKTAFFGKIGNDELAEIYEKELSKNGTKSNIVKAEGMTAKAITFVTPDTERTFAVNLGVASTLKKHEISEEEIKNSKILHLESYVLYDPAVRETALHAIQIAKNNNVKVSLDLSDSNMVKNNLELTRQIVKDYVNILFANETEAEAFTQKPTEEALNKIATMTGIAIVKLGENGSLIRAGNITYKIKAVKTNAVDTTGAGDSYAAAFLYALTQNKTIPEAGNLASKISSKVVEQIGARLTQEEINKLT